MDRPLTVLVETLGGVGPTVLVVSLAVFDVGCIGIVVWHGILSRMATKKTNKAGNKRGLDHTTTKPVKKSDGRLKENGGGKKK